MTKISIAVLASVALVAACGDRRPDPAPMPADVLTQQLVNKTLTSTGSTISLLEGNRLIGRAGPGNQSVNIAGAWQIREGRFCRTLTEPSQLAGTECQDISIDGDSVTIDGVNGPVTYIMSDT